MTATLHSHPRMPARLSIVILLVLSLLFGAQARQIAPAAKCGTAACATACCGDMPCCKTDKNEVPQPSPLTAPQRDGIDQAMVTLLSTHFLFELPAVEMAIIARNDAAPHALPRLAVSCIRLI